MLILEMLSMHETTHAKDHWIPRGYRPVLIINRLIFRNNKIWYRYPQTIHTRISCYSLNSKHFAKEYHRTIISFRVQYSSSIFRYRNCRTKIQILNWTSHDFNMVGWSHDNHCNGLPHQRKSKTATGPFHSFVILLFLHLVITSEKSAIQRNNIELWHTLGPFYKKNWLER